MSSLISKARLGALLFIALAGCGRETVEPSQNKVDPSQKAKADGKVECALAGAAKFARICSTEQFTANGTTLLVLRHPDGGFRRFSVLTDGKGLAPADGYDETRIILLDHGFIELSSGDDKYRLPAQIKDTSSAADGKIAKHAS